MKSRDLFCFLVLNRHRSYPRDVLAGSFWADSTEELARKCLRTTLWRLGGFLTSKGNSSPNYLLVDNDEIAFNQSGDYWLDVEEFEKECGSHPHDEMEGRNGEDINAPFAETATRAIDLYKGDLLEGCYEDWCLNERERLQEMYLSALTALMTHYRRRGNYQLALRCGQRILGKDPLLEQVHREIMRLHCLAGNRGAALRQYRSLISKLDKELGVEPMAETSALYTRILSDQETVRLGTEGHDVPIMASPGLAQDLETSSPAISLPMAVRVDYALRELKQLQAGIHQLGIQFDREVEILEGIRQELNSEQEVRSSGP